MKFNEGPLNLKPVEKIDFDMGRVHSSAQKEKDILIWKNFRNRNRLPHIPESTFTVEKLKSELSGEWKEDSGPYCSIAIVNSHIDGIYSHASDGNIDILMNKTGGVIDTLDQGIKYLRGRACESVLSSYEKVKRVIIEPISDAVMGIDGEILPLSKVVCIDIIPSQFITYGEY